MKRFISIFLCAVLLLTVSSAFAEAEKAEYTFLGIPWLSSVDTVKSVIAEKMTEDIPMGEFGASFDWWALAYKDHSTIVSVPFYSLTYKGKDFYDVAGFNVDSISVYFAPNGADGTYSDTDYSDYQMMYACYEFEEDDRNNYDDIADSLIKKLTILYGEPSDKYNEISSSTSFVRHRVWFGENNSMIYLEYCKNTSVVSVELRYYYADTSYINSKTNLTVVSNGSSSVIDAGAVNGL